MKNVLARLVLLAVLAAAPQAGLPTSLAAQSPAPDRDSAAARGEAVYWASGGCGCHTDYAGGGKPLAGGRAMKTPFGRYYATNLTSDPETGLGRWSEADFVRAMREGVSPAGQHYFPVFPYTSFTRMTDADLGDLWVYLRAQTAVRRANTPHDVWPPFGWRFGVGGWKRLYFRPGPYVPDPARTVQWNRGAYLATAVAHCGECHTPRNLAGALRPELHFAGSVDGPEGELAPNITPDAETGIGRWTREDLDWLLETGFKPDGDDVQGLMGQMIEHGYAKLGAADRAAIVAYVFSLPPISNTVRAPPKTPQQ